MTSTHVLTGNTIILVTFHLDKSPTKVLALNSTQLFIFSVATWLLTPQKHKKMYCLKSVLHRMKLFFFFFFLEEKHCPSKVGYNRKPSNNGTPLPSPGLSILSTMKLLIQHLESLFSLPLHILQPSLHVDAHRRLQSHTRLPVLRD